MTITENHIKTYANLTYKHTEMVRYKGKIIALAMDDQRRIYYSVLDLNNADDEKSPLDVHYWLSNPKELHFPTEIGQIGYGIIDPTLMPIVKKGSRVEAEPGILQQEEINPFLSSTARFTADAPFQALSDGKYIYIFRQSINSTHSDIVFKRYSDGSPVTDSDDNEVPVVNDTLLVDRFILAGTDLLPKREVRYKRSRNKYRAQSNKDSLGAQDMEKKPFYEPTHELDFVRNLQDGRFSVLLLPTQIAGIQRWQIFTHNSQTGLIDSFNVERFNDGLFNTKGTQFYTSPNLKYQKSVFERQPGICPFTGEDLIPLVSESNYAESTISFDGQTAYVTIGSSLLNNQLSFTIEGWIRPFDLSREKVALFGQNDVVEFGLDGNQLKVWTANGGSTSCEYPNDGQWHHVALVADGTSLSLYIDGSLLATGGSSTSSYGNSADAFQIGAGVWEGGSQDAFLGQIDEVRFWNRARSESEIKLDLHYRLVGEEPGLTAYWQFDEGSGKILHDRSNNNHNGTLVGNPQWEKSDAPIRERPGISRMSFNLAGRTVESGISAILYYQQEKAATGYDQQEKPLKKNARVMLALGTRDEQNAQEKKYIGVLDFAVSREGKLGQIPDNIALPLLSNENLESGSSNDSLDRISSIEDQIGQLQGEIKQLESNIEQINLRIPVIEPELTQIGNQIQSLQQELGKSSNLRYKVKTYTGDVYRGGTDAGVYVTLKGSLRNSREFEIENSANNFESGCWDTFGPFDLGDIGSLRQVRIRHNDSGMGAAWYLSKVVVETYQGSNLLESLEFRCMKWLASGSAYSLDRTLSPSSSSRLRDKVQIQNDIDGRVHEQTTLEGEKATISARKDEYERRQVDSQKSLSDRQKELVVLKAKQGEAVPFPMSLVHVDPLGLTTSGGFLGFAYTKDTPQLFESATGKLALYFRGLENQFFAAYYDTNTKKAQSLLPATTGNITFTARAAEPELDQTTIAVSDGVSPEYCTVVIQNTATDITETWKNVPREVEQFANVFNGNANKELFIGSLVKDVYGIVTVLTLEEPVKRALEPGETLLIGQTKVQVDSAVGRDATEIAIASATIEADINTSIYHLPYDYQLQANTNKPSYSLENGSLQFIVSPGKAKGNIQNGTADSIGATASCQWVPQSPGKALAFDGQDDYVGIKATSKATSNSFLSSTASALKLDGSDDYVELFSESIPVGKEITISFWSFGGDDLASNTAIFNASAPSISKNRTVAIHLPWSGIVYFDCGSDAQGCDRIEKKASESEYKGVWSHWAFTKNAATGEMKIYLNGNLWHSGSGKYKHLAKATKACLGNTSYSGESKRNWSGKLDEVRIWNRTRTQPEIQSDMNQRLKGNESGLAGYWRFEAGIAKDYTGNGRDGTYHGNPLLSSSSPIKPTIPEKEDLPEQEDSSDSSPLLTKSDADGDLTLEAWVNPSAVTDTTRIIHHHSPDSKYTLGLKPHSDGYHCFMGIGNQFKQTQEQLQLKQWQHLAVAYNQSYALEFNGSAYLSCDHNPTLDIAQDLTIEVFLQVKDLQQPQGILSKGQLADGTEQSVPYSLYIDTDGKIAFAFEDKDASSHVYKSSKSLDAGQFYKIAVTRAAQIETKNEGTQERPEVKVNQWADIRFYIDRQEWGYFPYEGKDPGGNSQSLDIGKTYQGSTENFFQGIISEIRLYNTALKPENLGTKIQGNEEGLISWWRFEENEGNVAYDAKSNNHAVTKGAKWIKTPDPKGSTLFFFQNGSPMELEDMAEVAWGEEQFTLGANHNAGLQECFAGTMEEVRIWKVARTQEQIQDNLFSRLKGEKEHLIANYTFDLESDGELQDNSLLGNHLSLGKEDKKPTTVLSTAPISDDIAQVRSALGGVKTLFHDVIHCCPAIEEYGDLQYSSNGNLVGVHKRCYGYIKDGQWTLLTGYKVGNLVTEWIGQVQANPQIIGYIEGAPPVPSENLTSTGLKLGEFEDYNGASAVELEEADSVNYIYSASNESGFDTAIELLVGVGIDTEAEAGVGFTTKVADVNSYGGLKTTMEYSNSQLSESSVSYGRNTTKASRLELKGTWEQAGSEINPAVGRRFIPSNLGFTLVQSDTMDVFALRLTHNNALVSYRMQPNPDIPKDWNIITFPLNDTYSKQGTLDGKVGVKEDGSVQCDPHYPNATNYGQYSYFKPIEAYTLKKRIEREQQELEAYYQQYSTAAGTAQELVTSDIPKQIAARNLFNTYVWTANGGFFSESTEVMESVQESNTGSYSFQGMGGFAGELNTSIGGMATHWELDALFGGHVETVKTKEKETERSFSLSVEVDGDNDLQLYANTDAEREKYHGRLNEGGGAYDEKGNPVLRPGKVDAYRFMSFYLEPSKDNFEDFFNKVVDPIWLDKSDEPNAVALRQANQGDKKPKCWRIMHRVTFVSRILPEITADNAPQVAKAMKSAHLESNYELIKKLEPFVKNKTQDYVAFADGVRDTIKTYLPELQPHEAKIIEYAALYFGVVSD